MGIRLDLDFRQLGIIFGSFGLSTKEPYAIMLCHSALASSSLALSSFCYLGGNKVMELFSINIAVCSCSSKLYL